MLYKIKKNADMKQTKKDYALQNQQKCIHKIFKKHTMLYKINKNLHKKHLKNNRTAPEKWTRLYDT